MEYFDSSKYNEIVEKMEKCIEYYERIIRVFKKLKICRYLVYNTIKERKKLWKIKKYV